MGELLLENAKLLEIIRNNGQETSDFVSMIELLIGLPYKIVLVEEDNLMEIFQELFIQRNNEDVKIINKLSEKLFSYKQRTEFDQLSSIIKNLEKEESNSFREILFNNKYFDEQVNIISYMDESIIKTSLRNIYSLEDLKIILLLFAKRLEEIESFIQELRIILCDIVFDEEIVKSIEELNDGFNSRKNEIIFHLFFIQKDIPIIISQGISGYQNIGTAMSLDCSPERNRVTVREKLIKSINGKEINCELHTKMERLSTNPPDRIYFCPCIPIGTRKDLDGKIFIFKVTKHA
jgi:hypothetical protein